MIIHPVRRMTLEAFIAAVNTHRDKTTPPARPRSPSTVLIALKALAGQLAWMTRNYNSGRPTPTREDLAAILDHGAATGSLCIELAQSAGAISDTPDDLLAFYTQVEAGMAAKDPTLGPASWRNDTTSEMLDRLQEEINELNQPVLLGTDPSQVLHECADVFAVTMMVLDTTGALPR